MRSSNGKNVVDFLSRLRFCYSYLFQANKERQRNLGKDNILRQRQGS